MEEIQNEANLDPTKLEIIEIGSNNIDMYKAQGASINSFDEVWPLTSPTNIHIIEGDIVELIIWDSSQTSLYVPQGQTYTKLPTLIVGKDGMINLPYAGRIEIAGLTSTEAETKIFTRLAEISDSAKLTMSINPGAEKKISVLGEVVSPKSIPIIKSNLSILDALAVVGGVKENVTNPLVKLTRDDRIFTISLEKLFSEPYRNIDLKVGDVVMITEDIKSFQVLGASSNQKLINFTETKLSLLSAIALSGGFNEARANPSGVLVLRNAIMDGGSSLNYGRKVFAFDFASAQGLFYAKNFTIADDDLILVTESPITGLQSVIGVLRGSVGLANITN